jgi:parallel beta-helix repeat protein
VGDIGIHVVDSDGTIIQHNLIADQGEFGIDLWNDATNTRVEYNNIGTNGTSSGSGYGFPNQVGIHDKGENNKITDNVISCNASYGLVLRCIGCLVDRNTIGGRNCAGHGNSAGNGDAGIDVTGTSVTISNNEIVSNRGDGIFINTTGSAKVTGNRIGPNQKDGVHINVRKGEDVPPPLPTNLMIGGTTEAERNWIGQNSSNGIHITSSAATIQGNTIGSGSVYFTGDDLGNELNGILIDGSSSWVMVGGNEQGAGNFIGSNGGMGVLVTGSGAANNWIVGNVFGLLDHYWEERGNSRHGVGIYDGAHFNYVLNNTIMASGWSGVAVVRSDSNLIYDNTIGTDGTHTFGNAFYGIHVLDGENNTIGRNTIAYNGIHNSEAGVRIEGTMLIVGGTPPGNYISQNSIFQNGGLGIELAGSGNNNQAAPTITLATCQQVTGTACPNCHIEIFSDSADEGKIYEGFVTVSASGAFSWSGKLHGPNVTATAEDGSSNTSAFSASYPVGTCP